MTTLSPLDRTRPPVPGSVRSSRFPSFTRTELQNGAAVYFAHWPSLPLIYLSALLPGGGQFVGSGRAGLASLHGELLDEGTRQLSALDIAKKVERLGAYLATGADWHSAYVAMNLLASHQQAGLGLLAELVLEASFPEDDVARICRQRQAEILRRRRQPRALADYAFQRAVYAGTVFAEPLIGTDEGVAALERRDFIDFYGRHVTPHGAAIVAVGAAAQDELLGQIESVFGAWNGTPPPIPPSCLPERPRGLEIRLIDRPAAAQTELHLGHLGPPRRHPDQPVTLLLNTLLGGKFTSRINLILRERHGLTYGAHSQFVYRQHCGHFAIRAAVATESTGLAIQEILTEMRRLQEDVVDAGELCETQDYLVGLFPSTLQTVGDIAKRLETLAVFDLPDDYYKHYPICVKELTSDEVRDAARRWLDPVRPSIVTVGPAAALRPQLELFGPVRVLQADEV